MARNYPVEHLVDEVRGKVITIDHAAVERRGWEAFVGYVFRRLEAERAITEHPGLVVGFHDLNVPPDYPRRALEELVKRGQATWDPCERAWRRVEFELDWERAIIGS